MITDWAVDYITHEEPACFPMLSNFSLSRTSATPSQYTPALTFFGAINWAKFYLRLADSLILGRGFHSGRWRWFAYYMPACRRRKRSFRSPCWVPISLHFSASRFFHPWTRHKARCAVLLEPPTRYGLLWTRLLEDVCTLGNPGPRRAFLCTRTTWFSQMRGCQAKLFISTITVSYFICYYLSF